MINTKKINKLEFEWEGKRFKFLEILFEELI